MKGGDSDVDGGGGSQVGTFVFVFSYEFRLVMSLFGYEFWALVSCLGQGPLFFKNYIYGNCVNSKY